MKPNDPDAPDNTAEKLKTLQRTYRAVGNDLSFQCDGFATARYRCTICGHINVLPLRTQAAETTGPCYVCGDDRVQERYRG